MGFMETKNMAALVETPRFVPARLSRVFDDPIHSQTVINFEKPLVFQVLSKLSANWPVRPEALFRQWKDISDFVRRERIGQAGSDEAYVGAVRSFLGLGN